MQRAQNRKSALPIDFSFDRFVAPLHALKLRATFPRAIVISMLMDFGEDDEITPQDLYLRIENAYGHVIPMVACYRILGDFEKAGFVQHRYEVRDGRASLVYRRAPGKAKDQGICFCCTNCLRKTPLLDAQATAPLSAAARNAGFHPATGMVIHGLCETCHFPSHRAGAAQALPPGP